MLYNNWLLKWNNKRLEKKEEKKSELVSNINNWNSNFSYIENNQLWNTKFEETVRSLVKLWSVSWKDDLAAKIYELHSNWFSLGQISESLCKFIAYSKIDKEIKIHKQSISRIIDKEKINNSKNIKTIEKAA